MEMLLSFTDFITFKEMMLDYKNSKKSEITGLTVEIEKADLESSDKY
jgi:hypothetical protein